MAVLIKQCGCKGTPSSASDFQDNTYGKGMRVCNTKLKKDVCRCSICGKEHKV